MIFEVIYKSFKKYFSVLDVNLTLQISSPCYNRLTKEDPMTSPFKAKLNVDTTLQNGDGDSLKTVSPEIKS
jgi:hypothetical protein